MKNKKTVILLGAVAGVILVAAAAFVGGRFLNQRLSPVLQAPVDGSASGTTGAAHIIPAPELPTTSPDITGNYVERQDNMLYVRAYLLDVNGGLVEDGSGDGGPKIEVVVSKDTLIYADTTYVEESATSVQQVIKPVLLDDISLQTMVIVWGRKVGDRMFADVIVVYDPAMIQVP